jgi:hypothetical protein
MYSIKVNRGEIEGVISYKVKRLLERDGKICVCLDNDALYELDVQNNLAFATGVANKTLQNRMMNEEFVYRKKTYKAISADQVDGKSFKHCSPIGPESIEHLWFS